jgi:thioredoxin-dependent peroxiredoxin
VGAEAVVLAVGDVAPAFRLRDQDGVERTLAELNDRPLLLVFYPADGTPGCTTQACDIRDRWDEFTALGVRVVGVSPDDVATHAGFAEEHGLPQTLLADPDHRVLEPYGAWGEKVLYGRTSVGVIRSSVLVGADGRVLKVWRRAQARSHAERALTACRTLLS